MKGKWANVKMGKQRNHPLLMGIEKAGSFMGKTVKSV
jgi:hypothetical protein